MWSYWLALAAYFLAATGLPVAARKLPRRVTGVGTVGLGLLGLALLQPTTCRSLIMPMCDSTGNCDESADSCSTLVGLAVPYADTFGASAARGVGLGLVAAGVVLTILVKRARTPWSRRA